MPAWEGETCFHLTNDSLSSLSFFLFLPANFPALSFPSLSPLLIWGHAAHHHDRFPSCSSLPACFFSRSWKSLIKLHGSISHPLTFPAEESWHSFFPPMRLPAIPGWHVAYVSQLSAKRDLLLMGNSTPSPKSHSDYLSSWWRPPFASPQLFKCWSLPMEDLWHWHQAPGIW